MLYKTAWEIKQKVLINMAADRGAFIDQSQSFNVFMGEPNFAKLTTVHFYGWKKVCSSFIYSFVTHSKGHRGVSFSGYYG